MAMADKLLRYSLIRLYIGFAVALSLVIFLGIISLRTFERQTTQAAWVQHTYLVINKSVSFEKLIVEMEASRRGYRTTGNTAYLDAYYTSTPLIRPLTDSLIELVMDNKEQLRQVTVLDSNISALMAYWSSLPVRPAAYTEEQKVAVTEREKTLMHAVSLAFNDIRSTESSLLEDRENDHQVSIGEATKALYIGIMLAVLVVAIMAVLIVKELKGRFRSQQALNRKVEELRVVLKEKNQINKQLERFTYVVAHDLKSPLTGIIALLNFIREDERIREMDDLVEYVDMLSGATEHLSGMIKSLLDYSRQNEFQQPDEDVDINILLDQLLYVLFPPAHIRIEIKGPLPVIHTKKTKLQQVFQNLLSNAIKYNDKKEGYIEVGYEETGQFLQFYVLDNGPGIAATDQQRIFRLFETTANEAHNPSLSSSCMSISSSKSEAAL
ncbi:MAG: hypothetical protein EOP49_03085 [Sphingobacteriales bacterium]|nr:MAG: hypothetical protein EOP49_03085 [Sphingobacteriales bacterium]